MNAKTIEIRDARTFIPALAVQLDPHDEQDRYLIARAGFGVTPRTQGKYVILIHLTSMKCEVDPHGWTNRTMKEAHLYIVRGGLKNLEHGEVIDVEFITGETLALKVSERVDQRL